MTISASVAAFIAGQRELLLRLEQFAETPAYSRLLTVAAPLVDGDEPWLAEWLIQPAFTLGELAIDALARPGGQELVELLLARIAACVVA